MKVPRKGVRPTQDRVRQALFSMLGDRVVGSRFADIYAGSGAVGLEAWSRGAVSVCWVEKDERVFSVLKSNVLELCGREAVRLVNSSAKRFIERSLSDEFDLIYCDPPYEFGPEELLQVQVALTHTKMLSPQGLAVMEVGARLDVPLCGCTVMEDRTYGETRILFLGCIQGREPADKESGEGDEDKK